MANLKQTQFPTTIRTVSGSVIVFSDDSVLLCDTSSGPVNITLAGIPYNYFSTQYKLYIIDKSNNASVNNITINAGTGLNSSGVSVAQTINAGSSTIINTNGGGCIVRIIDNLTYTANNNSFATGGGGSGYSIIQDEGISLPSRQKINFTGSPVTAVDDAINNATNVNINTFLSVTYSQLTTLISSSGLLPGITYYVTDGAPTYVNNGLIVQALSTKKLSLTGQCFNFNADYNNLGNYTTSPIPKTGNLGVWASNLPSVAIGNVVIYNNKNYISITGVVGTAPDTDTTNWQLLTISITKGYILEVDEVGYDATTNSIVWRKDKRDNYIETNFGPTNNPLINFQWGKDDCYSNKITGASEFAGTNSRMPFFGNTFENSIYEASCNYKSTQGSFSSNMVINGFRVTLNSGGNDVYGLITRNFFAGGDKPGNLVLKDMSDDSIFSNNTITTSDITLNTPLSTVEIRNNTISESEFKIIGGATAFQYISNIQTPGSNVILQSPSFTNVSVCRFERTVAFNVLTSVTIDYKVCSDEYSTFVGELDMSVLAIYNPATKKITIPVSLQYCGVFILRNCSGQTIELIENGAQFPQVSRFYPNNGETVVFKHTAVGSLADYVLLCDAGASSNTLTGRVRGSDYIEYRLSKAPPLPNVNLRNNLVLLA